MRERLTGREARQGRSGKQVLILMIVSMALLIGAYLLYNMFVSAPRDRQAISSLDPTILEPAILAPANMTG